MPSTSLLLALLVLAVAAVPARAQTDGHGRLRYTINEAWRYADGEWDGAAAPGFVDTAWQAVHLPHTWNAADAFVKEAGYRRGVGWYRKTLPLAPALRGRRLFLYFEGANQVADVYVNGREAGRHVGGYTAFAFDVTNLVRFDAPNVIAVRVDNSHDDDIPPLNADFTFYGGIYRDVWLVATDPLHVDVLDHASPGVFIDTPGVSREAARVAIRATVVNETGAPQRATVVHRVLDAAGRAVTELRTAVDLAAGAKQVVRQESDPIPNPRLWSPEDPYRYRVVTEVYDGGRLTDRVENPLGFRWFSADGDGFSLNGERRYLAGTNRHQDYPGLGNALPDALHREDVRLVKANGFDFLRLAHYPQDPAVLEATDRLGLVVWEEVPVVNRITLSDAFAGHSERMLVEMIRQHYNHPSILMWGYMNEVMLQVPRPLPDGYYEAVLALAQRLEARTKAEDPYRLTVTAQSQGEVYNGRGVSDVPDVLGMNLYFGWYNDELHGLGPFLDRLHAEHPGRPLLVSEYGAGSDERVHTAAPRRFDFSSEYTQVFHRASWAQLQSRPYLTGSAVWNQFDFSSSHRQDTKFALNQKGLFFFDRTPKDVAFYYQAHLVDAPVLHVAREWSHRAGSRPEDRTQPVWVYTNLDTVELFVDGASMGRRPVVDATTAWDVALRDGASVLRAEGMRNGEPVIDEATFVFDDRTALFTDPAAPAHLAVNAGASRAFTDPAGVVWEADRLYTPGGWGYVGGVPAETHHRIFGTGDDPLYQTARDSVDTYRFDMPDGLYEVTLAFAETRYHTPGRRVFDVTVNEQPVFTGLDLAARFGRYTRADRTVPVHVAGGTGITIRFDATAGGGTVNGIRVRRL